MVNTQRPQRRRRSATAGETAAFVDLFRQTPPREEIQNGAAALITDQELADPAAAEIAARNVAQVEK